MSHLTASEHLAGLRHLLLYRNPLGGAGVLALARSTCLRNLRSLHLGGVEALSPALGEFLLSPVLGEVESLVLNWNPLRGAAIQALYDTPMLRKLRDLSLSDTGLTAAEVRSLVQKADVPHLQFLNLSRNIGATGVAALLAGPLVRRLKSLNLEHCNLGDRGAEIIASSALPATLRCLDLSDNEITDRGAAILARSRNLADVARLSLDDNPLTDAGIQLLRDRFGPESYSL
jgi:hypothetical protein